MATQVRLHSDCGCVRVVASSISQSASVTLWSREKLKTGEPGKVVRSRPFYRQPLTSLPPISDSSIYVTLPGLDTGDVGATLLRLIIPLHLGAMPSPSCTMTAVVVMSSSIDECVWFPFKSAQSPPAAMLCLLSQAGPSLELAFAVCPHTAASHAAGGHAAWWDASGCHCPWQGTASRDRPPLTMHDQVLEQPLYAKAPR